MLHLIEFGFPLDCNRNYPLRCKQANHSSASEFPKDIEAYLAEESKHKAILGPFESNPIIGGHSSPFMTRHKPNSEHRRVIIDLSWPLGASVNAGIDKHTYLGSEFELTFPSVDDITEELKRLGRGALLYKVDVSLHFAMSRLIRETMTSNGMVRMWIHISRSGHATAVRSFNV